MDFFDYADELGYGDVHFRTVPDLDLHAVIAVHSLELGPAIGGCRFIEYDCSEAAIRDVMRLARGMTYKAAISDLPHGGGKSVVIRPPDLTGERRNRLFREFGRFVESLGGDYITAEDSGTTVDDMDAISAQTEYVLGRDPSEGGAGDPSPFTARGVRHGIEAAVAHHYKQRKLSELTVAIQGVGSVGYHLADELHRAGADLVVTDVKSDRVKRCVDDFDARGVPPEDIYETKCDVFAPCALGAVLNNETIPELQCDIVAGSANNQLKQQKHDDQLQERGILYVPDYAVNAGGLIHVAEHYAGRDLSLDDDRITGIYNTLANVLERAASTDLPPGRVADRMVEEKLGWR